MSKSIWILFAWTLSQQAFASGDFTFETKLEGTYREYRGSGDATKTACIHYCYQRIAELKGPPFSQIEYKCDYKVERATPDLYRATCDIIEITPYTFHGPEGLLEPQEPTHYI